MISKKIQAQNNELFKRADQLWDKNELGAAFRLFLQAAKAGDQACQVNVGAFYADGIGIKRNRTAALYWYKLAYRKGDASAASNIGVVWRDEGHTKRALFWFQRAAEMGDGDANLEVARIYRDRKAIAKATKYLESVLRSSHVTEANANEARTILRGMMKSRTNRRRPERAS